MIYQLDKSKSMYVSLYQQIKADIEEGKIREGERLPSKRSLAEDLKISVITVQSAYDQLISEGYVSSKQRSGYFACKVAPMPKTAFSVPQKVAKNSGEPIKSLYHSDGVEGIFPFSVWAKNMRQVISESYDELLKSTDNRGCEVLRRAISEYLYRARGMQVCKENIIIGAGTEYLYGLIVKLLGRDMVFGIEDPCHRKIKKGYQVEGACVEAVALDSEGISRKGLEEIGANIAHTSPNHQFPTGVVMPYSRRVELMDWAYGMEDRYIVEDDYDSEFRFASKPIPSIFSIDYLGKTIYINTFSKTIAPSLRISYMVLPDDLLEKFQQKLGFIACTVSSFEQYVLAKFIVDGTFERHIKKTKKYYKSIRDDIIEGWKNSKLFPISSIMEEDSGLHFALKLQTKKSDEQIKIACKDCGIELMFISDFSDDISKKHSSSSLLINYAKYNKKDFLYILEKIWQALDAGKCSSDTI